MSTTASGEATGLAAGHEPWSVGRLRRVRTIAVPSWTLPVIACVVLMAISAALRSVDFKAYLWIDDAQALDIARHPLAEIPGLLRLDGAPPLYYLLLHLWTSLLGSSRGTVYSLALVFALLCVPAGLWAGWSLFGRRAGLMCAALAALNPALNLAAGQARMYSLVALLSILAAATFAHAFVLGRRRYLVALPVLLTAMLYTHYWSIFFIVGLSAAALAVPAERDFRHRLRDAVLVFGAAAVAYGAWIPTLLFQAAHTGAPWANIPSPAELLNVPRLLLGVKLLTPLTFAAGVGLAIHWRDVNPQRRRMVAALALVSVLCVLLAWLAAQGSRSWAPRYFVTLIGPLMLLLGGGLAQAGRLGLVTLILGVLIWSGSVPRTVDYKSNVHRVAAALGPGLASGDMVLTSEPEQLPVLVQYLPPGLRYASSLGAVSDPTIMDWRDAVSHLRAATFDRRVRPLLDALPAGRRLLFVEPVIGSLDGWRSPWNGLVLQRTEELRRILATDPRLRRVGHSLNSKGPVLYSVVEGTLYLKVHA